MKFKKILSFFLAVLCCFSLLIPSAFAAESAIEKELANVIDFAEYPANPSDTGVYLITLMEKGYNGSGYDSDAGIYVYLYNPSKKEFKISSVLNTISFSKKFNSDGSPGDDVTKVNLSLSDSTKDGLFIRARVDEKPENLVVNKSGARHYAVSEFELFEDKDYTAAVGVNAEAYECAYDFAFSGSGTNLKCERTSFLTIKLNVESTSYISGDSAKGGHYSNMVSSVYFSVPDVVEEKYGKLHEVKYETYKYYTSPIVLIESENANAVEILKNNIGVSPELAQLKFWADQYRYETGVWMVKYVFSRDYYEDFSVNQVYPENLLPFYAIVFDVLTLDGETEVVSSDELLSYFVEYSEGRRKPIRDKYASNLFKSQQYIEISETLSIEDHRYLPSYDDAHDNVFHRFWDWVLGDKEDESIFAEVIKPIVLSDFNMTDFSKEFLVAETDVLDLKNYVSTANANGENTYLFRFAFDDDYYAASGQMDLFGEGSDEIVDTVGINIVTTPVYLDFDILSLGFSDNGEDVTTFAVVSSPVDAAPTLKTEIKNNENGEGMDWTWLKLLIGAFVGLFALYVFVVIVNWFKPKKKKEEKIVIQMLAQPRPPSRYYPKRHRSRSRYRRGRRR